MLMNPVITQAVEFTETYKKYKDAPVAIREAMCLKAQYPALLGDIRQGDLLAGRRGDGRIVYLGPIWWFGFPDYTPDHKTEGKQGGYCFDFSAIHTLTCCEEERRVLEELTAFWREESTVSKISNSLEDDLRRYAGPRGQVSGGSVGFLIAPDIDKLLQRGIPGLLEDIAKREENAKNKARDTSFFEGLRIALEVVEDVCNHYKKLALEQAEKASVSGEKKRLEGIARNLAGIVSHAPQSFAEAIQLLWIYLLLTCGRHIENWRIDVALGDFYAKDIDWGVITEEEAIELILSYWRLINENGELTVCRLIMGGKGRRNEINADRFTLAALEATARHRRVTPQVSLRFYNDQNPQLLKKAYDTVNQSCTYPTLYNDDVIIPGISEIMGVSPEEAGNYHPLGCGEYMLGGCSPSLLDVSWNIPKTLDSALHNGSNSEGGSVGPKTGTAGSLDTFEKLYGAVLQQIRFASELSARYYRHLVDEMPKECSFLLASLLTDDCMERGRGLFDGGLRYTGACAMGHGFTNAADALTAIKKYVYQDKRISLAGLVAALDSDFEGFEELRRLLLNAPKYGNDNDEADDMLTGLWKHINKEAKEAGIRYGLDFHTVSSVNPGGYSLGNATGATADGRRKGEPFAIGNSPTAGFDKNGLTALMNSVSKVDPANGGAITNFKISREFFAEARAKLEVLFKTYFEKGGFQANITVVNKGDLEAALKEPEKYPHVLVRLGGWTARFIDLERSIQEEILRRTLY